MGLNFAIYDRLTRGDRGVTSSGIAGSISGAFSKMIVYPMDTIKKRLQAQAVFGSKGKPYQGMVDCCFTMMRQEGVFSFYSGLVPSVLKTTMSTGLSFAFYRMTRNFLEALHDDFRKDHKRSDDSLFDR